ncbi:MAG: hypothetical protein ACTSPB_03470 [Candidatus Thorarchaeota archaeon]
MGTAVIRYRGKLLKITCSSLIGDGLCKRQNTWLGNPPCSAPNCVWVERIEEVDE